MARKLEITRTEAEYVIDILERRPQKEEGMAWYIADELRELFGMSRPYLELSDDSKKGD